MVTADNDLAGPTGSRAHRAVTAGKHWAGYGWFMTFGTFLPLAVFLGSYAVHVTLVGAPVARRIDRFGIWLSTLGQEPPGKDKLESRKSASSKKPLFERIRPYSPPGILERRGRPIATWARGVWFVLVGWWLGVVWVLVSWSVFLLPYPLFDTVSALLGELPSVMTLAQPKGAAVATGEAVGPR
jgi:uncharacterized membrane protein YccF (DUF307 family)